MIGEHGDDWHDGYDEGYLAGRDDIAHETEVELARFRGTLERIARAESGIWGRLCGDTLRRGYVSRR